MKSPQRRKATPKEKRRRDMSIAEMIAAIAKPCKKCRHPIAVHAVFTGRCQEKTRTKRSGVVQVKRCLCASGPKL